MKKEHLKTLLYAFIIILLGVTVYINSLSAPFMFDDLNYIGTPRLRHLGALGKIISETNRPIVNLSLAFNYSMGEMNVEGYHLFNLAVHILAALVLFGIIRRSLLTPPLQSRYAQSARFIALSVALIWVVHPLQTQAVTYIIQRAESMMGLFYLLTLYCVIRCCEIKHTKWWGSGAIMACALGMGSKEVMITAPILVFIYDRIFLSNSFKETLQKRGWIYLGLASTWILLFKFATVARANSTNAGFSFQGITPFEYMLTQPGVIVHYLKLSVWPTSLCFDYNWPVARNIQEILPFFSILLISIGLTIRALRHKPTLGFLGLCFFLILAPTSSLYPIGDIAVEHRMYLSLISVVILAVISGEFILRKFITSSSMSGHLGIILVGVIVLLLGYATVQRNLLYQDPTAMWRDVLKKNPKSARVYLNLANALSSENEFEEAIELYQKGLAINPNYAKLHHNLAFALFQNRQYPQARASLAKALKINPVFPEALYLRALLAIEQGNEAEAVDYFQKALAVNPTFPETHYQIALLFLKRGNTKKSIAHLKETIKLQPNHIRARYNLGTLLANDGEFKEAATHFSEVVRLKPDFQEAGRRLQKLLTILVNNP